MARSEIVNHHFFGDIREGMKIPRVLKVNQNTNTSQHYYRQDELPEFKFLNVDVDGTLIQERAQD